MPKPEPRKFTMADLMILVAGCAVGIAWTQRYWGDSTRVLRAIGASTPRESIQHLFEIPTPLLAMLGVAIFICRLRPPRPSLRRLVRQPGSVALACTTLTLVAEGVLLLVGWMATAAFNQLLPAPPMPGYTRVIPPRDVLLIYRFNFLGMTIALSWLILALAGRWQPEPSWIDRAGRFLGAWWIAVYIAYALKLYLLV